jgi:NADPH-dependent 2,4-dienoyl-CoA reductase/sulfur reductase-like enzyme
MECLIIGGSDAGVSAALRVHELRPETRVTVVLADDYPNFSVCGLPFYLSGEVGDWRRLAHRTEFGAIQFLRRHRAESLDLTARVVRVVDSDGRRQAIAYDQLLIATGARPHVSALRGYDAPGVFPLHTMDDSFAVDGFIRRYEPQTAIIVGSGYIGLEMADALTRRGLRVTVVGRSARPLPTVDAPFGERIRAELERHGVRAVNATVIEEVDTSAGGLTVRGPQFDETAPFVILAAGVRPSSELAAAAGIELGAAGAVAVDRFMRTGAQHVFAAGDCVETWHRVLERNAYLPLGTTAHKQGRVAGENMAGGNRQFSGSLGTQVVKIFDLAVARTGLRDIEAVRAGFSPLTVETTLWDHKAYYPGAQELRIRVTGDQTTGRLLGAQILGHWQAQVAKRIDVFATALFHGTQVDGLTDLDLSYTPPLGSPWDPVQASAQAWQARLRGGAGS